MQLKLPLIVCFAFLAASAIAQQHSSAMATAFQPNETLMNSWEAKKPHSPTQNFSSSQKVVVDKICLNDSTYAYTWVDSTQDWLNTRRTYISYDANQKVTKTLRQDWNGTAIVNFSLFTSTYDLKENQTNVLSQYWVSGAWVNGNQWIYTFDANNNQIISVVQSWNGTAWVDDAQDFYTFDSNNNQTRDSNQTWNGTAWVNSRHYVYTYDLNNNQTSILSQTWNGVSWVNSYYRLNAYDAIDNLINFVTQIWNGTAWENSNKSDYIYDTYNNILNILTQGWNGTSWENTFQYNYVYDAHNNKTVATNETWSVAAWAIRYQGSFTFDVNDNPETSVAQTFNGTMLVNSDSGRSFYNCLPTAIHAIQKGVMAMSVVPNPCQTCNVVVETQNVSTLQVTDIMGRNIATQFEKTSKGYLLNMHTQSAGIYFLRNSQTGQVVKFVKE